MDQATKPKQVVYIIRGLSGSGKSTLANSIVEGTDGVILSTDEFFVDPDTGQYNYNTKV